MTTLRNAPANLPRCGTRFLLRFAAKFLVRETRPAFRLRHPEDPVCWFALCEFSAQRSSRAKFQLTSHLRPLPEVYFLQQYGWCRSRDYCPQVHCPTDHMTLTGPGGIAERGSDGRRRMHDWIHCWLRLIRCDFRLIGLSRQSCTFGQVRWTTKASCRLA